MVTPLSQIAFIRMKYIADHTRSILGRLPNRAFRPVLQLSRWAKPLRTRGLTARLKNMIWVIGVSFMVSYSVLWHPGRGVLP
ncbi:hypothetical protein BDV39DRAFT_105384 [Aspergillus sergii]|uniref:Uncharacterized protein n=1 Tax=Aspergillus sergii TaxID=1034303 RepID=A0A5N6X148_9EURO|nr:hypothetical protein BDV39DRAFT_105384 [Aspergillus sergii]